MSILRILLGLKENRESSIAMDEFINTLAVYNKTHPGQELDQMKMLGEYKSGRVDNTIKSIECFYKKSLK